MSLRILLIGKSGQIGGELAASLPRLGETTALGREDLDLCDLDSIPRVIRNVRPDLIINAAAYTSVDKAESEPAVARLINTAAPAAIANEAKDIGAALIHFSTDYVFDGTKRSPYTEADSPNPLGVYGRTKLEGEEAIRRAGIPHIIFRTAWVYGTRGHNFLLTILRLASQRDELRVVNDQIGAPTWCRKIAEAATSICEDLLSQGKEPRAAINEVNGTYHLTAGGSTSWYGFAEAILERIQSAPADLAWIRASGAAQPPKTPRLLGISTADYPTAARRPAYSVLSNSLLEKTFGIRLAEWRSQLDSVFSEQ